jgi:hypothetical protein
MFIDPTKTPLIDNSDPRSVSYLQIDNIFTNINSMIFIDGWELGGWVGVSLVVL